MKPSAGVTSISDIVDIAMMALQDYLRAPLVSNRMAANAVPDACPRRTKDRSGVTAAV
jgi:hypothetical protein